MNNSQHNFSCRPLVYGHGLYLTPVHQCHTRLHCQLVLQSLSWEPSASKKRRRLKCETHGDIDYQNGATISLGRDCIISRYDSYVIMIKLFRTKLTYHTSTLLLVMYTALCLQEHTYYAGMIFFIVIVIQSGFRFYLIFSIRKNNSDLLLLTSLKKVFFYLKIFVLVLKTFPTFFFLLFLQFCWKGQISSLIM